MVKPTLNDETIRKAIHQKKLRKQHLASNTLVIDELGLKHGKNRADIAVINGNLHGIEIKSDEDSLSRLPQQIQAYNDIFDKVTIYVGSKHAVDVQAMIPHWWGVTLTSVGLKGGILFDSIRIPQFNRSTDSLSVAQLLWKSEVSSILAEMNLAPRLLRQNRSVLYGLLTEILSPDDLRRQVSVSLRVRKDWRDQTQPSQCGGSSLHSPK